MLTFGVTAFVANCCVNSTVHALTTDLSHALTDAVNCDGYDGIRISSYENRHCQIWVKLL